MKMKLGKYISVLISTLIIYFVTFMIFAIGNANLTIDKKGWASFVGLIILCFFFISSMLGIAWYSIKILFRFYKEKSLWKILTLCFGVGMILFSFVILGFGIQWIIDAIQSIFKSLTFNKGISLNYEQIWNSFCILTNSAQSNSISFGSYITVFICMVLWSAAGIAYEIIKKLLGGNKRKQYNNIPS